MALTSRPQKRKASESGNSGHNAKRRTKRTVEEIAEEGTTDSDDGPDEIPARTPLPELPTKHHLMHNRNLPLPQQLGLLNGRYSEANRYWEEKNGKLRNIVAYRKKVYRISILEKRGMRDEQLAAAGVNETSSFNEQSDVQPVMSVERSGSTGGGVDESGLQSAGDRGMAVEQVTAGEYVQSALGEDSGALSDIDSQHTGRTIDSIDESEPQGADERSIVVEQTITGEVEQVALSDDGQARSVINGEEIGTTSDNGRENGPYSIKGNGHASLVDLKEPGEAQSHLHYDTGLTGAGAAVLTDAKACEILEMQRNEIERLKRIIQDKDREIEGERKSNDFYLQRMRDGNELRQRLMQEKNDEIKALKHKCGERVLFCKIDLCIALQNKEIAQRREAYEQECAARKARGKDLR